MATAGQIDEAIEGAINVPGQVGAVLSTAEIETIDLLCEGEIKGPRSGEYIYEGTLGRLGWTSATFVPYTGVDGTTTNGWLRSVYWNGVPVLGGDQRINFQQVSVSYTKGTPNGGLVDSSNTDSTVTRIIGERLRASVIRADGNISTDESQNYRKFYRIYNRNCKGVVVNVRVNQLYTTPASGSDAGDIQPTSVQYEIAYRPVYAVMGLNSVQETIFTTSKTETIEGKITGGYIRSTRVNFDFKETPEASFIGWEIRITRYTPDSTSSLLLNRTFIDSITEIYTDVFTYPCSAMFRSKFKSEFFSQVPSRAFDVEMLKVKIPSTYDPVLKTYTESSNGWDGTFKSDLHYTDNPAWCFYDLLTNKRYGLGRYFEETSVDKWGLYEISKYCDELVADGFGGIEPRFTCNILINSRDEAAKVVDEFASIFRGMVYYAGGMIYTIQDAPKTAIYQFTNANIEDGNFEYQSTSKKVRRTVAVVRYNDPNNFFRPAVEYVEDVAGINRYGIREYDVTAFGCTSRGQAIRLGRWALLSENLETETVQFTTAMEGCFLRPGDIFKVFDANRKSERLGGRTYMITGVTESGAHIFLDDEITLQSTKPYLISLLTPGYYYDQSIVENLVYGDLTGNSFSGLRKPQVQTRRFLGSVATTVNGRTRLNLPTGFNTGEYLVSGSLVWTIESATGIGNYADASKFVNPNTDYYRVIRIEEQESNKFTIVGLQYAESKYMDIESGMSFSRSRDKFYTPPPVPQSLTIIAETQ